jgi:feruloyl esterase
MEVQRYPTDFDGIIAGDPAPARRCKRPGAGVPETAGVAESYLPQAKVELLSAATWRCDSVDGLKDGLIQSPDKCHFNRIAEMRRGRCAGLSYRAATRSRQAGLRGAKMKNGQVYSYGFPFGHEGGSTAGRRGLPAPLNQPAADGRLDFTGTRVPSGYRLSSDNFSFLAVEDVIRNSAGATSISIATCRAWPR